MLCVLFCSGVLSKIAEQILFEKSIKALGALRAKCYTTMAQLHFAEQKRLHLDGKNVCFATVELDRSVGGKS